MKTYFVCAVMIGLAACSTPPPQIAPKPTNHVTAPASQAAPSPTPELSDKQKISLLRAEAHKRHLRWKIFCVDLRDEWQFQGWAVQPGDPWGVYIEDGAKPNWNSHGATQAETAYNLFIEIQQPPVEPGHAPGLGGHAHKKVCPPELRGE